MRMLFNRLLHLLRRSRHDADLREEMETHRSLRQQKLERDGVTTADATIASRRALGNVTLAREDAREVWMGPAIEGVWQDARSALRSSRRNVASSLTIVVTLVFGIGLASAIFAFSDGYLARPLPFPDGDRLFVVRAPGTKVGMLRTTEVDVLRQSILANLGFVGRGDSLVGFGLLLQVDGRQVEVFSNGVGEGLPQLLQVPLTIGRSFVPEDYRRVEPIPVWLSHRLWQREFGGDPGVLQRQFEARSGNQMVTVEVVGVTDPRVTTFATNFGRNNPLPDLFAPGRLSPPQPNTFEAPIVRLPLDMSRDQAEAAIATTLQASSAATGEPHAVSLVSLRETLTGSGQRLARLFAFGGVLALVLVTVNLVHLLLARGVARSAEIATRSALGASRLRIARLLLFEGALYGAAGFGGGLFVGRWLVQEIAAGLPSRGDDAGNLALVAMTFDARVVVFAAVTGAIIAIAGAAWPSWRAVAVVDPSLRTMRRAGARMSSCFSRTTLVCEIAVSTVVLMGTVFIGLGIWRYVSQPLGFDLEDRFTLAFPPAPGPDEAAVDWPAVLDTVRDAPGVRHASVSRVRELRGAPLVDGVDLSGRELAVLAVGTSWLETRGVDLIAGRLMDATEISGDAPVAVVDARFARTAWPDADAVGQTVRIADRPARTVVGVIGHQRFSLAREAPGVVYVPQPRADGREALNVWAPGLTAADLSDRLRAPLQRLASRYSPVVREQTFDRVFNDDLNDVRFQRPILVALGLFAITLASIGLFGLVAYLVEQRVRDFGIRIALGAGRADVLSVVVRESALPAVAGLSIGLTAWWMLETTVRAAIPGWQSSGPAAMAVVSAAMLVVVVLAAAGPARRVLRIDPAVVLKAE